MQHMEMFAGRYVLVDPIADGGMGSVWRAWDSRRGRYVAAKLLRPADASSLLRFVREQSLRVEHPHVVAPTSWAADDDKVLLTMDLVRGGSVAHLLNDYGTLPVEYAAHIVDQLLDALSAVHSRGIVHRDLKPANLLLEPTGRGKPHLRLADFGIASVIGEPRLTRPTSVIGTPGYVSPEAMSGSDPDPRDDIYAVGVVGMRLLTGRNATAVLDEAPEGEDPIPPKLREALMDFGALHVADRPMTAAKAREIWRAALTAENIGPINSDDTDAIEVFEHISAEPDGFTPPPAAPSYSVPGPVSVEPVGPAAPPTTAEPMTPTPHPALAVGSVADQQPVAANSASGMARNQSLPHAAAKSSSQLPLLVALGVLIIGAVILVISLLSL